ncbi:MAG TPA: hypothetical protein VLA51_14025 [Paracoccaceae bacterium]|nr:hypothetical protein [Paracoccaceae bacterium]
MQRNITTTLRVSACAFVTLLLAACSGAEGDYPRLQPLSAFRETAFSAPSKTVESRAAALRARALRLAGPVIPAADKRRLVAALARHSAF